MRLNVPLDWLLWPSLAPSFLNVPNWRQETTGLKLNVTGSSGSVKLVAEIPGPVTVPWVRSVKVRFHVPMAVGPFTTTGWYSVSPGGLALGRLVFQSIWQMTPPGDTLYHPVVVNGPT